MDVICCYTHLHPGTRQALELWAPQTVLARLDPADDYAYWKAVEPWWDRGRDLLIIEQDIVVGPGTVPGMQACSGFSDWCAAPYPAYLGYGACNERALGCTRFSARLQAMVGSRSFRAPWQVMADRFIAMFDPLHPHRHAPVGHLKPLPEGTAPWTG